MVTSDAVNFMGIRCFERRDLIGWDHFTPEGLMYWKIPRNVSIVENIVVVVNRDVRRCQLYGYSMFWTARSNWLRPFHARGVNVIEKYRAMYRLFRTAFLKSYSPGRTTGFWDSFARRKKYSPRANGQPLFSIPAVVYESSIMHPDFQIWTFSWCVQMK